MQTKTYRWIVKREELYDEYRVKTTSPRFRVGEHDMVLDVYWGGYGEKKRDFVGIFCRYLGPRREIYIHACLKIDGLEKEWRSEDTVRLGMRATLRTRTRVGCEAFISANEVHNFQEDISFLCTVRLHREYFSTENSPRSVRSWPSCRRSSNSGRNNSTPLLTSQSARSLNIEVNEDYVADEVIKQKSSGLTQQYRNLQFSTGVAPIVLRYAMSRRSARRVRVELKSRDPETYYDERTLLWDNAHEREAVHIRRLFERMGGLYNKLAQDFATRDGLLPAPWVHALRGSFEDLEPRPWKVMRTFILHGLEHLEPIHPTAIDLKKYFAHIESKPLAAASIGQVHIATMYPDHYYTGEEEVSMRDSPLVNNQHQRRVIVKAIYPEIRKNLLADLANARRAAHVITTVLKLPMKGSIDAIMDEQCEAFPRELDLRLEAANIHKAQTLFKKHGLEVRVPTVISELSSSSVMTQTFCAGSTLASLFTDTSNKEEISSATDTICRDRAKNDVIEIARAIGITLFREAWFHSDAHPGNIMIAQDLPPALIDWGQSTSLETEELRTICHIVLLLATRSAKLIDLVLKQSDFTFNTEKLEHRVALLYYLFDSSLEIEGVVSREAMDYLRDAIRYTPKRMPVLTDVPREMVFFGRVCAVLRKCFELIGETSFSVIHLWRHEARRALKDINLKDTQFTSTALLLLPDQPDGILYALEKAPDLVANALNVISRFLTSKASNSDRNTAADRSTPEPNSLDIHQLTLRKFSALFFLLATFVFLIGPIIRGIAALATLVAVLLFLLSLFYDIKDLSSMGRSLLLRNE